MSVSKKGKDFWGPEFWTLSHYYGITYSRDNREYFIEYWKLLTRLLPCEVCRKNLTYKLKRYPTSEYLISKEKAFFYTYFLHDLVNKHVTQYHPKSPKVSPSFESVRSYYIKMSHNDLLWKNAFWNVLFILATTYRPESSKEFERFLWVSSNLLPNWFSDRFQNGLRKFPPKPYLRNNNDAFFYVYLLFDNMVKRPELVPQFDSIKYHYFKALGEECSECNLKQ